MPIHLITGPMYSGKTSQLINILQKRNKNDVLCIKHTQDVRFLKSDSYVISHNNKSWLAYCTSDLQIPVELYRNVTTIAIDEGQFFKNIEKKSTGIRSPRKRNHNYWTAKRNFCGANHPLTKPVVQC